ncbi:hypothetical protein K8T06_08085 [bacterium]|nr:hypothetical protein [bacterium]
MKNKVVLLIRSLNIDQIILIIGSSFYIIVYIVIAAMRFSYPFELEWMEGGAVVHVQRILDGQSLYVPPSLDFIPFIYAPFYYYVSSIFAQITGNGFLPLRLVSFLSSLGCFVFIALFVHRRTSSLYASFIASCLFAATFRLSGAWFDIARVDSLFLFLLLVGIYAFDSPRVITRSFIAPVILFLSFFTKQTALAVAVGLSLAVIFTRKRSERFWFPLNFSLLAIGSFAIMNTLTDGWYKFYAFDLPREHSIVNSVILGFWTDDLIQHLAIALSFCVIPFLNIGAAKESKSNKIIQDIFILGSLFLTSYFTRIHSMGYSNVLMPAYAGIAIYFGIGFAFALKKIGSDGNIKIVIFLATSLQFVILFYSPNQQIPSAMDRQQGEKLQQLIMSFKGEVYLSDHPWYLANLNKPTQAQDMAIRDIMRGSKSKKWARILRQEMLTSIAEKKYEALL